MSLDNAFGSGPIGDKLTVNDQEKVGGVMIIGPSSFCLIETCLLLSKAISALSESISDSSQLDGTVISSSGATFGEWMIKR